MGLITDARFFQAYADRQARIRLPQKLLWHARDAGKTSREVGYVDECEQEFRQLGEHRRDRRRIIVWRVPKDNPFYDPQKLPLLKIPFLSFQDEEIEDTDDVLLPILRTIMTEQLETSGRA